MFPITAAAIGFDHFTVIHTRGHSAAVKSFHTFSCSRWNLKPHGNITGNVISTHAHTVSKNQVFLEEDRNTSRPTAHINAGSTQLLLIFDQSRVGRHIGRGSHTRQLNITALHTAVEVLNGMLLHGQNMKICRKLLSDMATWISHP